jgi:hypothetical protein
VAQQQHQRLSGLGTPEQRQAWQDTRGERQGQRQEQWQQNQQQRQERRDEASENWQDYAGDRAYYGSGYYGGYNYAGAAAAAAVAGVAVGAAAAAPDWNLPCDAAATVVVGSTTYYQCGSTWYIQVYSDGDVAYTIVNPPAGY